MATYVLNSDKHFIFSYANPDDQMTVWEYVAGDIDTAQFILTPGAVHHWRAQARISPRTTAYNALQVFGVTIKGDRLIELAREIRQGNKYEVGVNRLGLCVITQIDRSIIKPIRINDYFGWSKYGVTVPREASSTMMWNRFDMFSGETVVVVDVGGGAAAREAEEELRRSLEEKSNELRACRKELEEKEEKLKVLESQRLAFKAGLRKALG